MAGGNAPHDATQVQPEASLSRTTSATVVPLSSALASTIYVDCLVSPLPSIDIHRTLVAKLCGREHDAAFNASIIALTRRVELVVYAAAILLVASSLSLFFIANHSVRTLASIVVVVCGLTFYVHAAATLVWDVLLLVLQTFDFWFLFVMSVINTVFWCLLFHDARAAAMLVIGLVLNLATTVDANVYTRRLSVRLYVLGPPAVFTGLVFVFAQLPPDVRYTTYYVRGVAIESIDLMANANLTVIYFMMVRGLRSWRLVISRAPLEVVRCDVYLPLCRLESRRFCSEARTQSNLNVVPAASQTTTAIGIRPLLVQHAGGRGGVDVSRFLFPRFAKIVPIFLPVWTLNALGVTGCVCSTTAVVWKVATAGCAEDPRGTTSPPLATVGFAASLLFVAVHAAHFQPKLARRVLLEMDAWYMSFQITCTTLSMCDTIDWQPLGVLLFLTLWLWNHWVTFLDALPAPTRSRLGNARLLIVVVTMVQIAYPTLLGYHVYYSPARPFLRNRVLFKMQLGDAVMKIETFGFLASKLFMLCAWSVRSLWRELTRPVDAFKTIELCAYYTVHRHLRGVTGGRVKSPVSGSNNDESDSSDMSERRRMVRRPLACSPVASDRDDNNQSPPVHGRKMELKLDDPAVSPPPEYEPPDFPHDDDSQASHSPTRPSKSKAKSSGAPSSGSIYDYLDEIETQSELQMQTFVPGSVGSRSIAGSDDRKHHSEPAWDDAKSHSPAPSYRSASARSGSDASHQYVVGIKEKLATLTIELNDKSKTIELLKMARKKDKAKMKQLLAQEEDKYKAQLKEQQARFEKELEKHLDFTQNVVTDKAELTKRCDELLAELQKANAGASREAERFKMQLKDAKERWQVQEKAKREQWIAKKTEEIKKSTVKALEPDIQAILAKGKADLDKAQEVAAEERRKLHIQLEKDKDAALMRLKDEYERKLVDAREKERSKLMTRLDAADAELQQQLSSQRRRLQEEAEVARNEVYAELRAMKAAHAKELEELKSQEAKRLETAKERFLKEKEELARKYDSDLMGLREQTSVECEQFKAQLTSKLRHEMEKQKEEMEKQMLVSRDSKLEMVIERLQQESREAIDKVELKARQKLEQERREWERKLKQTSEIEGVWMEKNRELHDKLTRLEETREQLRCHNDELSADVKKAHDKSADLAKLLHEERRLHEKATKELERQCASQQNDAAYSKQQQAVEATQLREQIASMETALQEKLAKQQREHEAELTSLHERVKHTIARKDHVIANLQEELHIMQVKLDKSHALIEEQRLQLFGE